MWHFHLKPKGTPVPCGNHCECIPHSVTEEGTQTLQSSWYGARTAALSCVTSWGTAPSHRVNRILSRTFLCIRYEEGHLEADNNEPFGQKEAIQKLQNFSFRK